MTSKQQKMLKGAQGTSSTLVSVDIKKECFFFAKYDEVTNYLLKALLLLILSK